MTPRGRARGAAEPRRVVAVMEGRAYGFRKSAVRAYSSAVGRFEREPADAHGHAAGDHGDHADVLGAVRGEAGDGGTAGPAHHGRGRGADTGEAVGAGDHLP